VKERGTSKERFEIKKMMAKITKMANHKEGTNKL